jgi:hypothetical protein
MAKNSIYGTDPTSMAEGIASDALSGGNGEDFWGGRTDARANSWDGSKDPQPSDVDVVTNLKAGAGDDGNMDSDFSKSTPRHRTVSLAAEDGINTPPKRFSGTK